MTFARLFWGEEKEKTRFDKHDELNAISLLLTALKSKTDSFQSMSQNNAATLEYRKGKILGNMLSQINTQLNEFNRHDQDKDPVSEKKQTIKLLQDLVDIIYECRSTYSNTLNVRRDERKQLAGTATDALTFTVMLAGGAITSIPVILTALGAFVAAPKTSKVVKHVIGLDKPNQTASFKLINDLFTATKTAYNNLVLDLVLSSAKSIEEPDDEFKCPITKEVMVDPVICTLDGYTYERTAIERVLGETRKTPMTRAELNKWQSVQEVLVPNRALHDLIERHYAQVLNIPGSLTSSEEEDNHSNNNNSPVMKRR